MASSWKSLTGVPSFAPDTMLLMTDGTVLIHDAGGKNWYRLKPDGNGKYDTAGVSWSGPFSMANTRQFYASGVLADGSVFVLGGEYSDAGANTPLGEIFDPQTNTWSPMNKPTSFNWINGDASGCILTDGRVLLGALQSSRSAIWDPALDTWTEAGLAFGTLGSPTKVGTIDEETWSLLPDGTVLTVDISSPPFAEKYVPATDTWVVADKTPATLTQGLALLSLTDTTVSPPVPVNIGEIGPAILLPDGRLFFIGATGHTALYTHPAVASQPGSWTAGPDLPADTSGKNFNSPNGNIQTAIDAPAVLLPGGKVLFVGGQTVREVNSGQTQFWSNPSTVFVYDPATNGITQLGSQPPSNAVDTWQSRLLLLPNGQILMTTQQSQKITILVDAAVIGTAQPTWKPTITAFTPVMAIGHHYKISGRQINGLSQACCYGDDAQMGTNYPLARFTNKGTGAVSYFRTFDFSTFAVATGAAVHSTLDEIPASAAPGAYTIQVIANGIASDPVDAHIVAAAPAIAVNLQDGLQFGTVCSEPQFLTIEVFNVGNADLIVDSVARLSGSSDFTVLANPVTPLTISAGDHVGFSVRFEAMKRGVLETATIRITSNDPVTPHFDFLTSGTRGTGSLATVIADSGTFGEVCIGGFSDMELTLNNNGPCKLSVLGISSSSPEFQAPSVLSYPLIVGAGDSIDIPIRFQPANFGAKSAAITVTSDDLTSPKVIRVSGNAPAPRLVTMVADSGNFGNVCLDSFADESVTLCNAAHCMLTVTNITSSSTEFLVPSVLSFPFTIAAGNDIEVPIRFQPSVRGARSATITVFSNDPTGPHTVAIVGNVPSGKLAVTGSTYFGEVDCGIAEKTVSICNVGDCKLHVFSVAFSRKRRHFKLINNPFPATLHPGSCLGVVIQYRASCEPECCELVITSDDPDQPVKVLDVVAYTRCEKKCERDEDDCDRKDRDEDRRDDDC
jgi:Abnormal spindle-like microcephaly-assoc'd, ASPM-SPD-2-Hydin/Galactose oxidase, central domain